ncbi:hypothetical protein P9112_013159 [Eukaryota sp. TZLM1-RC]
MSSSVEIPGYKGAVFIGEGADGAVYKATQNGNSFCIKVIYRKIEENEQRYNAIKPVTQQHQSLCPIWDTFRHEDKFYVVMKFYPKNLTKIIYGVSQRQTIIKGEPLERDKVWKILWQLVEGIQFLRSKQLAHRDLKPENTLLDENNNVAICDFDRLTLFETKSANPFQTTMTPPYHPPEMFTTGQSYGAAADYFALGVIFYEMLVGEMPYNPAGNDRELSEEKRQKIHDAADIGLILPLMAKESQFRKEAFNIVLIQLRHKFGQIHPSKSTGDGQPRTTLTSGNNGSESSSKSGPDVNSSSCDGTTAELV